MSIEKTAFMSYRRANIYTARAARLYLKSAGFDVFLASDTLGPGDFYQNILHEVASRSHFILILTPSSLEQCVDKTDWVRREIEWALERRRNIVPLLFDGFDYNIASPYLVDDLQKLTQYQFLKIFEDSFERDMAEVVRRFLNYGGELLHPGSQSNSEIAKRARQFKDEENRDLQVLRAKRKAEHFFELGFQAKRANDIQQALLYYNQAIQMNPHYTEAYKARGMLYQAQKQYDLAIKEFTEAIRLNNGYAEAYHNRGLAYSDKKQFDYALSDFQKAVELNPQYAYAYDGMCTAYLCKRRYQEAIQSASRAIDINKEYKYAYFHRGRAYKTLGHYHRALADFTRAIELGFENAQIYERRAAVYIELQQCKKARADYQKALELAPNSSKLREKLASLKCGLIDPPMPLEPKPLTQEKRVKVVQNVSPSPSVRNNRIKLK